MNCRNRACGAREPSVLFEGFARTSSGNCFPYSFCGECVAAGNEAAARAVHSVVVSVALFFCWRAAEATRRCESRELDCSRRERIARKTARETARVRLREKAAVRRVKSSARLEKMAFEESLRDKVKQLKRMDETHRRLVEDIQETCRSARREDKKHFQNALAVSENLSVRLATAENELKKRTEHYEKQLQMAKMACDLYIKKLRTHAMNKENRF